MKWNTKRVLAFALILASAGFFSGLLSKSYLSYEALVLPGYIAVVLGLCGLMMLLFGQYAYSDGEPNNDPPREIRFQGVLMLAFSVAVFGALYVG